MNISKTSTHKEAVCGCSVIKALWSSSRALYHRILTHQDKRAACLIQKEGCIFPIDIAFFFKRTASSHFLMKLLSSLYNLDVS